MDWKNVKVCCQAVSSRSDLSLKLVPRLRSTNSVSRLRSSRSSGSANSVNELPRLELDSPAQNRQKSRLVCRRGESTHERAWFLPSLLFTACAAGHQRERGSGSGSTAPHLAKGLLARHTGRAATTPGLLERRLLEQSARDDQQCVQEQQKAMREAIKRLDKKRLTYLQTLGEQDKESTRAWLSGQVKELARQITGLAQEVRVLEDQANERVM